MKRALIIGSQTLGLSGVHNDVAHISSRFERRGFTLDIHVGDAASRAGILDGLQHLISDSQPGDAALIYYSGHGARLRNPRAGREHEPLLLHCLVPTDWSNTSFRGLLDLELSLYLAELTQKTKNVSVILDCCHSARMWRGEGDAVARALDRVELDSLAEHLDALRQLDRSKLHAESNPDAVRLVAAEADRSAFELNIDVDGETKRMGVMTAMLGLVLDELGDTRVSWRTLALLVRERVMQRYGFQRPEIEGPSQRYVFETATAQHGGGVAYFYDHGEPALRAGRLLGAEPTARFAIMPVGVTEYDERQTVAEAEVTRIVGTRAHVRLQLRGEAQPSAGALAFPLTAPLGKHPVRVQGQGQAAEALRALIGASKFVALADRHEGALLTVYAGKRLTLLADSGAPLSLPEQSTDVGRHRVLEDLERWARAETLRNLPDGGLRADFEVDWGRIVDGERVSMTDGQPLHVGDRIYIEFHNLGKKPLLFAAFDIGVDGAITLLTAAEPTGTKLEPGQSYVLGLALGHTGLPVSWPETVPDELPLPESLLIIVSEARHDFVAFELASRQHRGSSEPPTTALGRLLEQIGTAGTRNIASDRSEESDAYTVVRHGFLTDPRRRVPFAVDQPLARAVLEHTLASAAGPQPSQDLIVRLNELLVHDNRAVWGESAIRIDTLCTTGGCDPVVSTYVFPGIGDGDRVPFDNIRIFQGTATGFIDFAIWVSKHDDGSPTLPALVREIGNDPEFTQATTALAGLAVAGPQAATLAAAIAAGATVTYFVNRVVERVIGRHIGLYRTSFLPLESWGIGRHPQQGSIRAQEFSFSFDVISG
jgi:hypothetical protein